MNRPFSTSDSSIFVDLCMLQVHLFDSVKHVKTHVDVVGLCLDACPRGAYGCEGVRGVAGRVGTSFHVQASGRWRPFLFGQESESKPSCRIRCLEIAINMASTSPVRLCYLGKDLPDGVELVPQSVRWDPTEPDVVAASFEGGFFVVWKYSTGSRKVYNLQQASMPMPTFSSDTSSSQHLPDLYGVTEPRAMSGNWLDFRFGRVGDQRELFLSFQNSNKVLRSKLSLPSEIDIEGYVSAHPVFDFAAHAEPVTAMATKPYLTGVHQEQQAHLLTGAEDGSIILWDVGIECGDDLRTLSERTVHVIRAHEGSVRAVCFSGTAFYISSGDDQAIRIWRMADGVQACYFPSEKVVISKITCGLTWDDVDEEEFEGAGVRVPTVMIAAGSKEGSVFLWKMTQENEIQKPTIRLVGLADHTRTEISAVSMFPIKSRYGESDGVGVIAANDGGSVHIYKYGRAQHLAQLFEGETVLDQTDILPSAAFELMHEASYDDAIISGIARYELNLGRAPASQDVAIALIASKSGDIDVLTIPAAGHHTAAEASVSGITGLSVLVSFREQEETEEELGPPPVPASPARSPTKVANPEMTAPISTKIDAAAVPDTSPAARARSPPGPFSSPIQFGEGFETVLKVERYEEADDEPQEEAPEPIPQPTLVYKQQGRSVAGEEHAAAEADDWAAKQFGGEDQKDAILPSDRYDTEPLQLRPSNRPSPTMGRISGARIDPKYWNKERALALIEVEKQHKTHFHVSDEDPMQEQRLGFQGADPPYFSSTKFPISELMEPSLNSTLLIRERIKRLQSSKFDFAAAEKEVEAQLKKESKPPRIHHKLHERRYTGLVSLQDPPKIKKKRAARPVTKATKAWRKEISPENKPVLDDIPGFKDLLQKESNLSKVDFYTPAEAVLSFHDRVGQGQISDSVARFRNAGYLQ